MRCRPQFLVLFIAALWLGAMSVPASATQRDDEAATTVRKSAVPPDHAERIKRGTQLFQESVRSILAENCLACHGGQSVKADFDLSTRELLFASGHVSETAADSQLMQLITHEAEPHMPHKKDRLSEDKIRRIRQWIDLGAPYDKPLRAGRDTAQVAEMTVSDDNRRFWSFRKLNSVDIPAVNNEAWCRTPIDRFILSKLEQSGIHGNAEADRRTLIRRAYGDSLGLPPTPEEVETFVSNPRDDAWQKLVDQILLSPHYGERWARHWMDVARFAESHGYEQDYDRPNAFHYRDFLIRALNADMPYDQFVRWQLAGDEFAPDDPLAMMATGFLGAGVFPTQLTENEFESARYDELDDMVTTTGVAFLGLSVGCARCHDHKFDPIPSRDYYRMAATFATAIRSEVQLDLEPEQNRSRQAEWDRRRDELSAELKSFERSQLPQLFRTWLENPAPAETPSAWEGLQIDSVKTEHGTHYDLQSDGSWLAKKPVPPQETVTVLARSLSPTVTAIRIEALANESLPQKGPGRAGNGNFVLTDLVVKAGPQSSDDTAAAVATTEFQAVPLTSARATHQQNSDSLSVAGSIDGDKATGWAVDGGGIGKDQAAVFDFAEPIQAVQGTLWQIQLSFGHPNPQHSLGRFRLSVSGLEHPPAEVGTQGLDARIAIALEQVRNGGSEDGAAWKTAIEWFATTQPAWQQLKKSLDEHQAKGPQLQMATVMVTSEGLPHMKHNADDRGFPHFYPETFLLKRGDVHQKQQQVEPGFLQTLTAPTIDTARWTTASATLSPKTSHRRAALANWMTDAEQGAGSLAARVIVNRIWQHHFGRGLVPTPNDFGTSGDPPSHPALLDWLALELIRHDWSLKYIHRLIMNSSVYMQSAEFDETRAAVDRENQRLWRWSPRRLEGEAIRDSMLAVSGLLDRTMYGPGTLDQNMKRRSVYFFIKRSQLIPAMMLFDWPEHLVSIGQRSTTTIAPQALSFLNSPQGRQYSAGLASRVQALPSESNDMLSHRVQSAYRLVFSRPPMAEELRLATEFLRQQSAEYTSTSLPDAELLALTDFCQMLLSMNEFIYIE